MKISFIILSSLSFLTILFASCGSKDSSHENNSGEGKINAEQELLKANDKFYSALNEMFVGNLEQMKDIWSHSKVVTNMGPFGDRLAGWDDVKAQFEKEAGMKLGGKVVCKDLIVYAGKEMGYTVCTEEGENMSADGKPVIVRFRATNIFMLENGQWKMVHHHTDLSAPLQEATKDL